MHVIMVFGVGLYTPHVGGQTCRMKAIRPLRGSRHGTFRYLVLQDQVGTQSISCQVLLFEQELVITHVCVECFYRLIEEQL